mgnify:CR=1 FL=1
MAADPELRRIFLDELLDGRLEKRLYQNQKPTLAESSKLADPLVVKALEKHWHLPITGNVSSMLENYPTVHYTEGWAMYHTPENALKAAMDWKVRKNLAAGRGERGTEIIHFERAFHGRTGYTLSLTNTDPRKIAYFPKFPWPRIPAPALDFALPAAVRQLLFHAMPADPRMRRFASAASRAFLLALPVFAMADE